MESGEVATRLLKEAREEGGLMEKKIGFEAYEELLSRFKGILLDILNGALISMVLYGSVARRQAERYSDIDLLIILSEPPASYYQRLQPVLEAMKRLKRTSIYVDLVGQGYNPYLSFLILSEEETRENRFIFLDMIDYSVILFDRDGFIAERLESLKRRLEALGSKKVFLEDGSWYWDLKPDLVPGEVFEL
ncbi:MAG: nucleotidyltransferase domain-containing protein [Candidatus Binatia bacterium]